MLHRGSILVVDDEPALRELMSDALAAEGYRVLVADNGARALELLRHDAVDAIVLDLMMPTVDGWGFIDKHRKASGRDIGLVCVSAAMSDVAAERLRALGVRSCLAKPFELDELVRCVAAAIDEVRRTRDRRATPAESNAAVCACV